MQPYTYSCNLVRGYLITFETFIDYLLASSFKLYFKHLK